MDQDIDDLLDEVETKFMKTPPSAANRVSNRSNYEKTASRTDESKKNKNTLDALINDILDIAVDDREENLTRLRNDSRVSVSDDGNRSEKIRRCFPVFLGGSADAVGLGTNINKRTCDQLRCTSCDFNICFFDNMAWNKDTDYLFLRNNVPDFKKLQTKMSRKKGNRAYCCQCCWRNISDICEINDPSLKWVCSKHLL